MYSITHGEITFDEMYRLIKAYISDEKANFEIAVGTDSQNFDYTKVPVTIGVHKIVNNIGRGGIFFSEIKKVKKITNMRQKLFYETYLSIELASNIQERFLADGILCEIAIHIDAGLNGPTSKFLKELKGWVMSCGFKCVVKPDSYMASSVANRLSK